MCRLGSHEQSSEQTKLNITTRRSAYPQKLVGSSKIDIQFTQRTVREPSLSDWVRPMSPKGPRGNFKHQSVRVSMASIYSSHWNGRTGNTKGVIAGASRLFGISRGHPRTPVKPPKRAW